MRVRIKSVLPAPSAQVWQKVQQSQTLLYVTKGLLSFDGTEAFPAQWRQGLTIHTRLKLFSIFPLWPHQLVFDMICQQQRLMLTQESGGLVSESRHFIQVQTKDHHSCYYLDEVEIRAGLFTPVLAVCAWLFYRYCQWRWKRLLGESFLSGDKTVP